MPSTIVAATFVLLAVLHSAMGERLLLTPLLASPLPSLPIGRWLGGRTLRFAWHATSVAWLALAVVVLEPSSALVVASLALLFSGAVTFAATRGRHFAWVLMVAGGLVGLQVLTAARASLMGALLLVAVAALHLGWVLGLRWGSSVAVPTVDGRASFHPSRWLTLVAGAAFSFGALVAVQASRGGIWRWLALAGAVVCLARVVGDARLVGLFKRVRGTPFATWDDLLFTPLSFGLALCFAVVAAGPA
ncbi:MAG: DUF3995 domain-containing protein [Myxococcales bacterium]|nr:DUF3995 domain-containing protein [Myxococcales bacterium]MDP3500393.1 DUF3995 domain-containing protein [Myxococcales bacterium]